MKRFQKQFWRGTLLFVVASLAALLAHRDWHQRLPDYSYISGWILFGFMLLLALFNVRKKLPFLPLGKSENWLQLHVYGGFFTVVLFLIHLNFRLPRGGLDISLTGFFSVVTLSGIVGLVLSRMVPRRLQTRGGEVLYEKIPAIRHALQVKAETLALDSPAGSPIIAEFYVRRLAAFFAGPRHFWLHLQESRAPINQLLADLNDLRRLLSETDAAVLDQLITLTRQKDGLDYHQALQSSLKLWLFVHLPFTYGLMLFTFWHIVLVYAFSGGAQ